MDKVFVGQKGLTIGAGFAYLNLDMLRTHSLIGGRVALVTASLDSVSVCVFFCFFCFFYINH